MYARNDDNVLDFAAATGKLPPQNIEAEEAILGGILLDPDAFMRVGDRLKPEHFYISAHKDIYKACATLSALGKPTDFLSVSAWLSDNDLLTNIGGRNKLASLLDRTVSAVNIDALAELVLTKWTRRQFGKLANLCNEMQYKSDDEMTLDESFSTLLGAVMALQSGQSVDSTTHISDSLMECFQTLEDRVQGIAPATVPTDFYDLDDKFGGGLSRNDLVIVAGRPAMGKSAFAVGLAANIAKTGKPVAVFSLEMSKSQLAQRLLSAEAGVEANLIKSGKISESHWEPLSVAVGKLSEMPIYFNEYTTPSPGYFEGECRKIMAKTNNQLGLVVIDYLQLMDGDGDTRNNQLSQITRSLKLLAKRINAPVVALSQLSRNVEHRTNKRPQLADLRDSGALEQDADKVLMLYRDEYYQPDTFERGIAEVIIAKNREGETGTAKLLFDPHFTQFKNLARSQW
ncbi:replicative DNA helicase [Tolypothrix bouteillei VB521301_2]|uniref:Replicative DNA helicase n=1 Tax=Tolypothrix bouteillei VB521301 TaxID=1479485 RepID=A0A0C1RP32_9CYAN